MSNPPASVLLHSTLPQQDVVKQVISFMNYRGWILTHMDANSLMFARQSRPNPMVFILLLLLMLLPAFLYLLWGGRKEASSFFFSKDGQTTTIEVHVGPNTKYYGRLLEGQLTSNDAAHRTPAGLH
jgi:hypothetical protein